MARLLACLLAASLLGLALALPNVQNLNVIVVGAGISGLTVARQLQNANATVTILEGRARYGGRVWTDHTTLTNFDADLGASFIYGGNDRANPITDMAYLAGVNSDLANALSTDILTLSRSKAGSLDDYTNADMTYFQSVWNTMKSTVNSNANAANTVDNTFASFATAASSAIPYSNATMQYSVATDLEMLLGGAAEGASAKRFWNEINLRLGSAASDSVFKSGHDRIARYLVESNGAALNITYNTTVVAITNNAYSASVTTASGQVYTADLVICTVPLGVLKANKIKFSKMPVAKQNAMANIKFGDDGGVAKVYLQYSSKWWPAGAGQEAFYGYNAGQTAQSRGKWPLIVDFSAINSGKNVLMAICTGRAAGTAYYESLSDDAMLSDIKDRLQTIWPTTTIPDPTGFVRSRWTSDPFTLGTTSYSGVNATDADWTALAANIDGRIYFAGEHTNKTFRGTTHGAYFSGINTYNAILAAVPTLTGPVTGSIAQCSYVNGIADACPTVTFTLSHNAVSGGFLNVTFPSQTAINTASFAVSSASFSYSGTPAVDAYSNSVQFTLSAAITANTVQSVAFTGIKGASAVGSTSALTVATFTSGNVAIDAGSVGTMFFDNATLSAVTSLIRITQDIAKSDYSALSDKFVNAMLSAGVPRARFNVTSIAAGSTVINFIIYAQASASQPSAQSIFTSVQAAVNNPLSQFNSILPNIDLSTSLVPSVNQLCSDGTLQPSCLTYFTTKCTASCLAVSGTSVSAYACSTTKLTTGSCAVPVDLSDGGASLGVGLGFGLGMAIVLALCISFYYCDWKLRNYIGDDRMYPMVAPCENCGSKYSIYTPSEQKTKLGGCCKAAREQAEAAKAEAEAAKAALAAAPQVQQGDVPPVSPRAQSIGRMASSASGLLGTKSNFKAMRAMARAGSLTPRGSASADESKDGGEVALTSVTVQSS